MHFLFISIIVGYFLMNTVIVWWFWRSLENRPSAVRWSVAVVLAALAVLYPYSFWNPGTGAVELVLLKAGAVWTGIFIYCFILIVLVSLAGLLVPALKRNRGIAASIVAGLTALIGVAGYVNAARPVVNIVELDVDLKEGAPAGLDGKALTIAALSDVHLGRLVGTDRFERMIDRIAPYKPDLVLFAGDVLDDHLLLDVPALREALARLMPIYGVWGALGNHEYHSGKVEDSLDILDRMGIKMLVDRGVVLGDTVAVAGRDDYSSVRFRDRERQTLEQVLDTLPDDKRNLPLILLDHQPYHLEQAEKAGVDLQLSGHTHNGQLWPVNYVVQALYENAFGHTRRGRTHYLVSSGAGTWGPPVRTTARPEVLIIRMNIHAPRHATD